MSESPAEFVQALQAPTGWIDRTEAPDSGMASYRCFARIELDERKRRVTFLVLVTPDAQLGKPQLHLTLTKHRVESGRAVSLPLTSTDVAVAVSAFMRPGRPTRTLQEELAIPRDSTVDGHFVHVVQDWPEV